jgi:hypothetical protein
MPEPKEVPCSCQGRNSACVLCGGTGRRRMKACQRCKGTGEEGGKKCLDCRGEGWRDLDQLDPFLT